MGTSGENKEQSKIKSEVFTGHKPVPVKIINMSNNNRN